MASTAALELLVQLDSKRASAGLDELGEKGGGLGDLFQKGAMIAGAAVLGLGAALFGAASAAAEEEVGQKRLYGTLKNSVKGWDGNTSAIEDYVSQQTKLAFADDEVRDSLTFLTRQTGDLTEAQELQTTAMDLARSANISLEQATKAVGKVDNESIGILKKLGITVTDQMTKEEALAAIRASSAGAAQDYANTTAGSMERIQNSFGDVVETIGGAVLGIVSGPLAAFADWLQSPAVQTGIQAAADFIKNGLAVAFDAVGNAIKIVWPIVQPFFKAIGDFIGVLTSSGDLGTAFSTLFSGMGTAISNAWPIVSSALGTLIGNIWNWIITNAPTILSTLANWTVQFYNWVVNDVLPKLGGWLGEIAAALWKFITDNAPTWLTKLGEWTTQIWAWVTNVLIPGVATNLGTWIAAIWTWVTENADDWLIELGKWTVKIWEWVTGDLIPGIAENLGKWLTAIWAWVSTNAPIWAEKLGAWTVAIWGWVTDVQNGLPAHLAPVAQTLWNWIIGVDEQLPTKMHTLATRFGEMPADAKAQLEAPTGLPVITAAISLFIADAGIAIAKWVMNWVGGFWTWISGKDGVLDTMGKKFGLIILDLIKYFGTVLPAIGSSVKAIGTGIVNGIAAGIAAAWANMQAAFTASINALLAAGKAALGIKSPSTEFADQIGIPIVEGIGAGIQRGWPALQNILMGNIDGLVNMAKDAIDISEIAAGLSFGMPASEFGQTGGGGGFPGGGNFGGGFIPMGRSAASSTSIGGITINAGMGADGRRIADELIEELEYRLGDQIAIRRGTRAR